MEIRAHKPNSNDCVCKGCRRYVNPDLHAMIEAEKKNSNRSYLSRYAGIIAFASLLLGASLCNYYCNRQAEGEKARNSSPDIAQKLR